MTYQHAHHIDLTVTLRQINRRVNSAHVLLKACVGCKHCRIVVITAVLLQYLVNINACVGTLCKVLLPDERVLVLHDKGTALVNAGGIDGFFGAVVVLQINIIVVISVLWTVIHDLLVPYDKRGLKHIGCHAVLIQRRFDIVKVVIKLCIRPVSSECLARAHGDGARITALKYNLAIVLGGYRILNLYRGLLVCVIFDRDTDARTFAVAIAVVSVSDIAYRAVVNELFCECY